MDLSKFGVEVKEKKTIFAVDDKKLELNIEETTSGLKFDNSEKYLPWFLKYQLNSFDNMIITSEIQKILDFIENFKPGKALLLCGQAGSGKTTTINLLAKKFNFEIFELNASDARNKKSIEDSVEDVMKQKSLFGQEKLILIDEADGVSGTKDRGGLATITKLIKKSKYPICFTANDAASDKIKALKKLSIYIDFENHSYELLDQIAKRIFKAENIEFNQEKLTDFIEERATFDIRGFINDIQASVMNGKFDTENNLEIRDYKKKIESLLQKVFYSYPEDSYFSGFNTDINIDELMLYVEENIPKVYGTKGIIQAFNELSKANIYKGRIMKWQYWRYLVYVNFYLTYGVSNAKDNPKKVIKFDRNTRILKKWIYNNKMAALGARTKIQKGKGDPEKFIEKLAKIYGRSAKRTRKDDIKYFSIIYNNDSEFKETFDRNEKLGIDDSVRKSLVDVL
ncbi:MAG: AAA family ATPase [Nanoarchaeales archaeon]|nr:AAA family ATPase [Nanoarchaeales archaeon]